LVALVTRYQPADVPELGAFWSGAVGFFSYDVVRLIERLPHAPPRTQDLPDALFILTRALVIVDNLRAQARLVVAVPIEDDTSDATLRTLHADAERELDTIAGRLRE